MDGGRDGCRVDTVVTVERHLVLHQLLVHTGAAIYDVVVVVAQPGVVGQRRGRAPDRGVLPGVGQGREVGLRGKVGGCRERGVAADVHRVRVEVVAVVMEGRQVVQGGRGWDVAVGEGVVGTDPRGEGGEGGLCVAGQQVGVEVHLGVLVTRRTCGTETTR